jgi:hypothetical protein
VNFLQHIADELNAAADELEQVAGACTCPAGSINRGDRHASTCPESRPSFERLWSRHLRDDAKSISLRAQAHQVSP